jgi:hypothetical protein
MNNNYMGKMATKWQQKVSPVLTQHVMKKNEVADVKRFILCSELYRGHLQAPAVLLRRKKPAVPIR